MATEYTSKALHNPHFRKGNRIRLPNGDWQGESDVFPPITVNNPDQEAFYRAKGYLAHGEKPPISAEYREYPLMLSHPDHADAIPEQRMMFKGLDGKPVEQITPGSPEKFPHAIVNSKAEEAPWLARGYRRIGKSDADAVERAVASPFNPDFTPQEFPKMVDGKIVDPFNEVKFQEYPKWVGNVIVHNADEERAARKAQPDVVKPEKCVICGNEIKPSEASGNGPLGSFHLLHVTQTYGTEPSAKEPQKRASAGKRAAQTRKERAERLKQSAATAPAE